MSEVQLFHTGDLVYVAKDLGPSMSHFPNDCHAIVIGSYADQYGGHNVDSYTLYIRDKGYLSWYYAHQLTFITHDQTALLCQWKEEANKHDAEKSDLDWIFSHGEEVLEKYYGPSIRALAVCLDLDLWGSRGEALTYYTNAVGTMAVAEPFLRSGDKAGWLAHCQTYLATKHGT